NVNGLRAIWKKDFLAWAQRQDVILLQETKAEAGQVEKELAQLAPDFYTFLASSTVKKGYSGVALFVRKTLPEPRITIGFGEKKFDQEGRTLIAEFPKVVVVSAYFPNGGETLERVPFKLAYSKALAKYLCKLHQKLKKPILLGGDYNTAHQEIDLANPKANEGHTGFLPIERAWLDEFFAQGMVDIFRHFYPTKAKVYSWWSYRQQARARNVGWRIDYLCSTPDLLPCVKEVAYQNKVLGSDHCPMHVDLEFS
ncbi:MAG: exodeoxyribonuclease III, partial [Bacteriovoracaceae bacterium]|nr:exodeoxyribonuclease III [Bacteriovoracaceae bacterium]